MLEKLLNPILEKLDGWKTLIGLLGLLVIYLIRWIKPDWIDADTANEIWWVCVGLAGLGVASKDAKRIVKNGG